MKIEGSSALVFGEGERGLAKICVKYLVENGAKVVIADIRSTEGTSTRDEVNKDYPGKVWFIQCDATKEDDIEAAFTFAKNSFGGNINICFNAVGIVDEINWEKMVDINFNAVVKITLAAFKYMGKDKQGNGGSLIHIASVVGLMPQDVLPVYTATKHAVVGLVRSFGKERMFTKTGIRVNAVNPFLMDTQLLVEGRGYDEETYKAFAGPGANFTDKKTVALAMARLIEDECLNGECMIAGGGDEGIFLADTTFPKMLEQML